MAIIIPFTSNQATLANAGGKGANLARLTQAGFPVPPGFILSTEAYRSFVEANQLSEVIARQIAGLVAADSDRTEAASSAIRAAFAAGQLTGEMEADLRAAYAKLGGGPVAVRSSATTEDLPELSFAGQQDTYLNIVSAEGLLKAVVSCWSSLWTGRAIAYRLRNAIPHEQAALAVVVQAMVMSEVSGVLFTANPVSGLRSESVVDATFGLGEALVSGQVEPDHFVVDTLQDQVKVKSLGAKQVATRSAEGGGVQAIPQASNGQPALTEAEVLQVAELGSRIQQAFDGPQDIEFAFAGGSLYVLQTRPVTSLFPLPEVSFDPLVIWFGFGTVQGLVGPITPLGLEGIQSVAAGAGAMFDVKIKPDEQKLFVAAGQRIWVRISDLIRNPIGSRIFQPALEFVEPSVGQIIRSLVEEPGLGKGSGKVKFRTLGRLARFALPVLARMAKTMLKPEKARSELEALIEARLASSQIAPAEDRFGRLANILGFIRGRIGEVFAFLLPRFIPVFGPSMAALNLLKEIAGERQELALEVTRALPNNVTTEMDLALWRTAQAIAQDAYARKFMQEQAATELARRYLAGELPPAAQQAIGGFMQRYGMRGTGEIDFGQPRWREVPTPIMHTLQSYLEIEPENSPEAQFRRGQQAAVAAIEELAGLARRQRLGWLKERQVRAAAHRIRVLMSARESPKFFAIRTMGIARQALLEVGREFAAAGTIEQPQDLVFLQFSELDALARDENRDWKALVAERRAAYEREQRRRQVPRVLVSDGRTFYEGLSVQAEGSDGIAGSPVSPGVVEGKVRVVFDPSQTRLEPGEILVCPGTDPAWTPLFMQAGGLVTEVGGVMTHGSVVAREYGIPAVVGVHQATTRLKDGDRIRLDGTNGRIMILKD